MFSLFKKTRNNASEELDFVEELDKLLYSEKSYANVAVGATPEDPAEGNSPDYEAYFESLAKSQEDILESLAITKSGIQEAVARNQNDILESIERSQNDILESMVKTQGHIFETLTSNQQKALESYMKTQSDISMQIEEVYDVLQNFESEKESLRDEQSRGKAMLKAVIALSDMIEDFYNYSLASSDEDLMGQAEIMWKNAGMLAESCAITRLGKEGEVLDPSIHSVQSAVKSELPRECITQILRTGYKLKNEILRKAAVVVSTGKDEEQ